MGRERSALDASRSLRLGVNPVAYRSVLRYLFLLLGVVLVGVSLVFGVATLFFVWNSSTTYGEVIDFKQVENAAPFLAAAPRDSILYYPVIAYSVDGKQRQFLASFGGYRQQAQLGDQVAIRYKGDNARIAHWWYLWGQSIIIGGLGILFAAIGGLMPFAFRVSSPSGGQ